MLKLLLLGLPLIERAGLPLTLPRRRTRALLFYLAAQPGPVSREHLLGLLWPDHERSAAQTLLRTTLHAVRRVIGADLVGDDPLALGPEVLVDYRLLVAATLAGTPDETSLTRALGYYRGDLLDGFGMPDAAPFEEWLAGERERARLLAVRGMARMARLHEARGAYLEALEALQRALTFDRLQEDLQRDAMRMHYLAGDRVGAIRRYEQLRDLLDEELGVPPMRETRELYDALITDSLANEERRLPSAAPSPSPGPLLRTTAIPFIGRELELARLAAAVQSGRLGLIEGEPGIGKTRLGQEFLERTRRAGGLALVGAARELEQSLPYQPLMEALRALAAQPNWPLLRASLQLDLLWLNEAARLAPELLGDQQYQAPSHTQAEEARLWEAVARLLLALARRSPVALLLDDVQWADASSLAVLGYLLRRAEAQPLYLLATARPAHPRTPLTALVATLTREGRLERLPLRRLSAEETATLAGVLCPADATTATRWLQQQAEGNPYMITELVGYARETGLLDADGRLHLAASSSPLVPQTVYSLIASRLARLSDGARRVLDAAVAIGREFEFEVAARAAALSELAALDALDELRTARLVEPLADGRYRFDHSLTMEVAYREVGEPRHRSLHRRVGEALEVFHHDRLDEAAGRIAAHFAQGGAPERATAYALRAARRATAIAAWAEAVAFYEQALIGVAPARRFELLLALGEVLYRHGEGARAAEQLREALALARDPAQHARASLSLAAILVTQARYGEVIALMRPLAASGAATERARALFSWGTALSLEGADLEGAAERLREAEQLLATQATPDPISLAQVRFELGGVAAQQGDLASAVAYYHEARTVADTVADKPTELNRALTWRILARNNLAYHLHLLGDLAAAAELLAEGLILAEEQGAPALLPYLRSTEGELALARGELEAAEQAFNAGLALAERLVIPERVAGLTANLGLVALRRGETALAIHRLSAAVAHADALGTRHLAAQVRIWLAPLLPAAEARAALAEARAIAENGGRRRLLEEIARLE